MLTIDHGQEARTMRPSRRALVALAVTVAATVAATPALGATTQRAYTVRAIPTGELGVAKPTELAFSPSDGALLLGQSSKKRTVVHRVSLLEQRLGKVVLPALSALAVDPVTHRLTAVRRSRLVSVKGRRAASLRRVRMLDPQGAAYDTSRQAWFILDARSRQVVRVPRRGPITRIGLRRLGKLRLVSIAYNPNDRLLYVLTPTSVIAVDARGVVHRTTKLAALGIVAPQALVFAPSGDPTDDPAVQHMYFIDRGDADLGSRVVEAAFTAQAVQAPVVPQTVTPQLVQTIQTSKFSPPSPDPSGIAYLPQQDRLLVADSEVEEVSIWAGKSLWTVTRSGSGVGTGSPYPASKEPTGLGYDVATNTLFISDDDRDAYFVDKPGTDGIFGTADDKVTKVSSTALGIRDNEDLAFDSSNGHLYFCDGLAKEIFDVNPVDGVFGNGNDSVVHWDIEQYGARDCEGLGIDPDRGTLLAVDESSERIYELTKAGGLVRIIDVGPLNLPHLGISDITPAPTSNPSDGPGTMDYWVVDRQVDNGVDPKENDGKIYELTVGDPPPPPADSPPTVALTAPAAGSTVSGTVGVSASAADDHGVAKVEFFVDGVSLGADSNGADGWSAAWNTTLYADGSHVLTAAATDSAGQKTASSGAAVTVSNVSAFTVPVRTGSDDADEIPDGTVRKTNGDFELGMEQESLATTAAARFSGLPIARGAQIAHAYVQFTDDEVSKLATSITIRAEASDNASPFATTAFNLSSRPRTGAAVSWAPPQWLTLEAATLNERTPDLAPLLQAVVNRPGWAAGNAVVIVFTGTGRRTAESYEGGYPPVLSVQLVQS